MQLLQSEHHSGAPGVWGCGAVIPAQLRSYCHRIEVTERRGAPDHAETVGVALLE